MSARRSRAVRRAREVALAFFMAAFAALPGVRADGSAAPATAGTASGLEPEAAKLFDEGNAAFHAARAHAESHPADHEGIAKKYKAAGEKFAAAWRKGGASSEVFTNAANSHAFAGDAGEAILFYRRALAIDPANRVARQGLETLRASLPVRKKQGGAAASIARSLFFWHDSLGFGTRRAAFAGLWLGAFALLGLSLRRRQPFRLLAWCALVPALALLGSLALDAAAGSVRDDAVILTEVEGREGDGQVYSPSHSKPFPPGTEVTILSLREPAGSGGSAAGERWAHVRLVDGTESFIPEGVMERVIR